MDLSIQHEVKTDWDVLTVGGEIDLATAPELGRAIGEVVGPGCRVCLDLSSVAFIDSTGLRELIRALNAVEAAEGALVVIPGDGPVAKLLAITGLDGKLVLRDSVEQAVAG